MTRVAGTDAGGIAVDDALERATAFVRIHGDLLARARIDVLRDASPPDSVIRALAPWSRDDGGFASLSEAPDPAMPASAEGALEGLDVLEAAGVRSGTRLEALLSWLTRAQDGDGAWRASACVSGSEELGDPVVLTGLLLGHLAKIQRGSARTLARADGFLSSGFSPDKVESGGWRTIAAFAAPATNGACAVADEASQWCGRALEKAFRSGRVDALDAARTLLLCDVAALPGGRIDGASLVLSVLGAQGVDGGFGPFRDATRSRVDRTILGVRALLRYATPRPGADLHSRR